MFRGGGQNQRTLLRQVGYALLEGQAEDQCGLRSQGGGQGGAAFYSAAQRGQGRVRSRAGG